MAVFFYRAVIVGIEPADHEAGVASAGAQPDIARIGDDHIAAVDLLGEVGGGAPSQTGANHQEVDFAFFLFGALPVGYGHRIFLRIISESTAKLPKRIDTE